MRTTGESRFISSLIYISLFVFYAKAASFQGVLNQQSDIHGSNALFWFGITICELFILFSIKRFFVGKEFLFFFLFVINFIFIATTREDTVKSFRSVYVTSAILFSSIYFSALFYKLTLKKSLEIIIYFFTFLILSSVLIHLTSGGLFSFFMHENKHRLGGLFGFAYISFFASIVIINLIIKMHIYSIRAKEIVLFAINIFCLIWTDVHSNIFYILCVLFVLLSRKLIFIFFLFFFLIISNISTLQSIYHLQASKVEIRKKIWVISMSRIAAKPIVGYEKNPFDFYAAKKISTQLYSAHNAYLHHALLYGIQSLFLLLFFLIYLIFNTIRNNNKIVLLLIFFCIFSAFFWEFIFIFKTPIDLLSLITIIGIANHPDNFDGKKYIKSF